ncbi:ATP-binding protein [Streptomyces naphthomycinicus]|uniref:ATP-binding protein n=1 Tax=Streptomyces naphthomycinicus TaxID=2872625 RepID=UPI001CEDFAD7|nr:ATP-binding protein [Streptomyces sp. TML10]
MNPRTQRTASPARLGEAPAPVLAEAVELREVQSIHPVSTTLTLTALRPEGEPRFRWSKRLPATAGIRQATRIHTRSRLTLAHWMGDIDAAARVAGEITDNAAKHGRPFPDGSVILRLTVLEAGDLLVQVDDADPSVPNFAAVKTGSLGALTGLGFARRLGAKLDWHMLLDDGSPVGKTVQALLPATWTEAA